MPEEKKAPAIDRTIDLDAARAARAEKAGEGPVLIWKKKKYQLPPELPARFLDLIADLEYREALDELIEDGFSARFIDEDRASYDDLIALAEGITEKYGLEGDLGNLRPSGASS